MKSITILTISLVLSGFFYEKGNPNQLLKTFLRPLPPKLAALETIKESKILLDEHLASYIVSQAKVDGAKEVVLIADTIMVVDNISLRELDLILIANYFSTADKQIEILPAETDIKRSGARGKDGKSVQIIAKQVEKAKFHLPGMDGTKGSNGRNGKNGKKSEVKGLGDISKGTPGSDGQNGGRGGKGGNLILHTLKKGTKVNLTAPGGKGGDGGKGGKGGKGGTTFILVPVNKNPGNPGERPDKPGHGQTQPLQTTEASTIRGRKEKDGKNGKKGKGGIKGKTIKKILNPSQFETSVQRHYPYEWKKISQTGYQIIFNEG